MSIRLRCDKFHRFLRRRLVRATGSAVRVVNGGSGYFLPVRLNNPYAKEIQKTAEKSPNETAERMVLIWSSLGSAVDWRMWYIVASGQARLSRPKSSVVQAHVSLIVDPCRDKNPPATTVSKTTQFRDNVSQANHAPTPTTRLPATTCDDRTHHRGVTASDSSIEWALLVLAGLRSTSFGINRMEIGAEA